MYQAAAYRLSASMTTFYVVAVALSCAWIYVGGRMLAKRKIRP